jgi:ABC transporter substrate binding protein
MNRREFIAGFGSAAAWPLAARAQPAKLPVIGFLGPARPGGIFGMEAFFEGLTEGGYVEGRNAVIEYRWAEGRNDLLPALAADLVRQQARTIVTIAVDATLAAKSATTAIPIVFQTGADPVKAGLVSRLNQPGGNVTGVSNFTAALSTKRLELLRQLVPEAAAIGILIDPTTRTTETLKTEVREASNTLGLQLIFLNASNEQEIDAAFRALVQQRIGALLLADQLRTRPADTLKVRQRRSPLLHLRQFGHHPQNLRAVITPNPRQPLLIENTAEARAPRHVAITGPVGVIARYLNSTTDYDPDLEAAAESVAGRACLRENFKFDRVELVHRTFSIFAGRPRQRESHRSSTAKSPTRAAKVHNCIDIAYSLQNPSIAGRLCVLRPGP